MAYRLEKLAREAYDVVRGREVVAALVKVPNAHWVLELLDGATRPAPFTAPEHMFSSLAKRFLGIGIGGPRGARSAGFPTAIGLGEAA